MKRPGLGVNHHGNGRREFRPCSRFQVKIAPPLSIPTSTDEEKGKHGRRVSRTDLRCCRPFPRGQASAGHPIRRRLRWGGGRLSRLPNGAPAWNAASADLASGAELWQASCSATCKLNQNREYQRSRETLQGVQE